MKALKITLIITLFFASLTSCTKQDLNEDDVLETNESTNTTTAEDDDSVTYTGGGVDER